MDGGRIIRALLSGNLGRMKATRVASLIGQALAFVFVLLGFWIGDLILSLIGVFVFITASGEYRTVKLQETLKQYHLKDIFRDQFTMLYTNESMDRAMHAVMHGLEDSFLVYYPTHELAGVLHKEFIDEAIRKEDTASMISQYLSSSYRFIDIQTPLKVVIQLFQTEGYSILPVTSGGQIVGVIDRQVLNRLFSMTGKQQKRSMISLFGK
jgi:signal-transduction protein with cAMP-binding, CBS, and nucleotidyltransferase domain